MKTYTRDYLKHHGLDETDWIGCKVCGATAVDLHHIEPRQRGGSKLKDNPENLIPLCRKCHIMAEQKQISKETLYSLNC